MSQEDPIEIPKKSNTALFAILGVNTLLVVGVAVFVVTSMNEGGPTTGDDGTVVNLGAEINVGPIYKLQSFVVNLNEPAGDRYLRCKMDLEVTSEEVSDELDKRNAQVRHEIITYLSELRYNQTSGVAAKEAIRRSLQERLNKFLTRGKVKAVYFTEFVVQ